MKSCIWPNCVCDEDKCYYIIHVTWPSGRRETLRSKNMTQKFWNVWVKLSRNIHSNFIEDITIWDTVEKPGYVKGQVILGEFIPMLLWCPICHERHIDRGIYAENPHHTHACQACGHVWRPAILATVGVQFLPGFRDEVEGEKDAPHDHGSAGRD